MQPFEISLIVAALFLLVEMLTGTFVFLSFSIATFVISIFEFCFNGFSLKRDLLTFVVLTIISAIVLRFFFRAKGDTKVAHEDVNKY